MRRYKQYIMMATTVAMLLSVSCREKMVDGNESGDNGKLQFSPTLGEPRTGSRAAESDNSVLRRASAAGEKTPHIAIETYTGTPSTSLKPYFSEELGYFKSGNWDINSGIPRFLPQGEMNLYSYFATNSEGTGDLAGVEYIHPAKQTDYPSLTLEVAANGDSQLDLIAAKMEGIIDNEINIPLHHILSQINFGVKGIDQHQVTVKNIRINKVQGNGTFDYNTWEWTPDTKAAAHNYPYYFPDRKKGDSNGGLGDNYKTRGTINDAQTSYIFGDGGKFGPGEDTTYLYAQVNPLAANYATKKNTPAPIHNSLMLLPQLITKNTEATVSFDYEIRLGDAVVRSEQGYVIHLNDYHDWQPNRRYVYLFDFGNPSKKVTFDVLVEPWQNYNGGDGIVDTDELNSTTLFQKYVRPMKSGGSYSVPIGALSTDFICDWSLNTMDNSFAADATFSLSFDSNIPFVNGKSVIINPPFGFEASVSLLKAPGVVKFTAIRPYFSTSSALNAAIGTGGGNYEFSVSDAVKLGEITFSGSATAESSMTLHYLSPYVGDPVPRWSMYTPQIAVCFPNDYARTSNVAPYSYTIYNAVGLRAVLDWMNSGGTNPGGTDSSLAFAQRMQTNITLAIAGSYDLAQVYKANAGDMKNPAFVPIGNAATAYTGNFDGKGAIISNLYINNTAADYQGFFGHKSGTVQNINFTNVSVTGHNYIGAVAGLNGGGFIINCTSSGSVSGNDVSGGIAGANWNEIIGCGSSASIYGGTIGGIVGNGGTVKACYSTGNITGFGSVGGIAAVGGTTIACYSTSTFAGSGTPRGIVGDGGGTASSCYYVAQSNLGTQPAGVTRLPSIAMLNGKIPLLNSATRALNSPVHYVSGSLDRTSPTIAAGLPAARGNGGVLKGTFIQNWFALYWDEQRWNDEMALLATIGMEYLVIDQVMEYSDFAANYQYMSWYRSTAGVVVNDLLPINPGDALEKCMAACRKHGLKLYIGTFFDKRYWNEGAAVTNPDKWNGCITTANRVMDELTALYFNGTSSTKTNFSDVLAGWYFPYEVDDYNFQSAAAQNILKGGIAAAMANRNKQTSAKKPYLFSPFMNGSGPKAITGVMSATDYGAMWRDIILNTGFQAGDILAPQDCIGIEKFIISDISIWMPALKGAIANGVEFWINVEIFGPGASVPFLTTQQIPASIPYTTNFISFSYPIHYSPSSTNHKAYKSYYDAQ